MKYHPLLLKESAGHYDTGHSNIIEFEQQATIENGLGACYYNIIKYKNRDKGQNELDDKKIVTFEAWKDLLCDLIERGYNKSHSLRNAMLNEYPNMKYSLKD